MERLNRHPRRRRAEDTLAMVPLSLELSCAAPVRSWQDVVVGDRLSGIGSGIGLGGEGANLRVE